MLDELVLDFVLRKTLEPERLRSLLAELRKQLSAKKAEAGQSVKGLEKQLKGLEKRLQRLYEAIEIGAIDITDDSLKQRVQKLKASKESTLIELSQAKAKKYTHTPRILTSNIEAFSHAVEKRLKSNRTDFAKRYLQILARLFHQYPEFWGKLAKQVGRSSAEP